MQVDAVASGVPTASVASVLQALAECLSETPHVEFALRWVRALCARHAAALQTMPSSVTLPVFRSLQRVLTRLQDDLSTAAESNLYTLRYLSAAGEAADRRAAAADADPDAEGDVSE